MDCSLKTVRVVRDGVEGGVLINAHEFNTDSDVLWESPAEPVAPRPNVPTK